MYFTTMNAYKYLPSFLASYSVNHLHVCSMDNLLWWRRFSGASDLQPEFEHILHRIPILLHLRLYAGIFIP